MPAPKGRVNPMLRMFCPRTESPLILNGTQPPPTVRRLA
jgi:hypothetical protein